MTRTRTRLALLAAGALVLALAAEAAQKPPAAPATPKVTVTKPAQAAPATPIDLNTATQAQLEALPGVGPAYAKRIIGGRPYRRKDELVSRKILPSSLYKAISAAVVAKQS
jgi:DNA uptake protein ComE-like DNA-binding protein